MQIRNYSRHTLRIATQNAQAERDAGIPDRAVPDDVRQPITLDLRSAGGRHLRLEPRRGYIAWRAVDVDSGVVLDGGALKTLLHAIADDLPRMLGARNYQ